MRIEMVVTEVRIQTPNFRPAEMHKVPTMVELTLENRMGANLTVIAMGDDVAQFPVGMPVYVTLEPVGGIDDQN